ncbi:hypothetical protein LTS14_004448 [Recurvomyces mirabilis]|nr:hypothetical protein LTS14_004448 [Recurvomyces mirabilis]
MDDEEYALSLAEMERRDDVLALQVSRYQELAATRRQEERTRRHAGERQQAMLADDERLARQLDAEERGLAGAEAWDRQMAEELAREQGGNDDFNFGGLFGNAFNDAGGYANDDGLERQHDQDHEHGHGLDHVHDHEHGLDDGEQRHHEFVHNEEKHDREPLFVAEEGQADDPMAENLAQHIVQRNARFEMLHDRRGTIPASLLR